MKLKFIFLSLTMVYCINILNAQNKTKTDNAAAFNYQTNAGLGLGFSLTGLTFGAISGNSIFDTIIQIQDLKSSSAPAINGNIEYMVNRKFSIGAQLSVQSFKFSTPSVTFTNQSGNIQNISLNGRFNRVYFGARFNRIWGKEVSTVQFYSSVRLGFIKWFNSLSVDDRNLNNSLEFGQIQRIAVGIVPIGCNIAVSPNLSINTELNLGAPHIFGLGLRYHFGTDLTSL